MFRIRVEVALRLTLMHALVLYIFAGVVSWMWDALQDHD